MCITLYTTILTQAFLCQVGVFQAGCFVRLPIATVPERLPHALMASSSHEPQPTGVMIEDMGRLLRLLGFIDQIGMPGSEGRRVHSGLSPEEQLSSQSVMAPLPVEIPWPLGIAARRSALPSPRDSMSLGVASRWSSGSGGASLRRWDGEVL